MTRACHILGISRQAYYQQCQRAKQQAKRYRAILGYIQHERMRQPQLGARKLLHLLNTETALKIGRDKLFELLKERRLLVQRRRAYHKTTQSRHRFWCHPNLLKPSAEQAQATRPEQIWVADITYLPVRHGEAWRGLPKPGDRCVFTQNRRLSCTQRPESRVGRHSLQESAERISGEYRAYPPL